MNKQPVVIIDSGIGGLPYMEWIKSRLPDENFVYIADNKNFPFGTKTRDDLIRIMTETMSWAVDKFRPKAAVIACNTASVVSLAALRSNFSFPIIGVVPAVKPAAFMTAKKRIGLMASNRTIDDEYTEKLITDFASQCVVARFAGTEIINFIENELQAAAEAQITAVLKPAADFFKKSDVDSVVLGCTHFLFLEDEIRNNFGDGIRIIDSREGVGRQVIKVLTEKGLLSDEKKTDYFHITGLSDEEKISRYGWVLNKYGLCAV